MLNRKCAFFVLVLSCLIVSNAVAVPTVKRLGGTSGVQGLKNTAGINNSAVPVKSRSAQVRSDNLNLKPATVSKISAKSGANNALDSATSRLSVGKYIHNQAVSSGLVKPAPASGAVVSSSEFTDLKDRVYLLEDQVATKQPMLIAGDGVVIEDDVISLTEDINTLPDDFAALASQMNEKVDIDNLSSNYYNKLEVEQVINNQIVQNIDDALREHMPVVNEFDKEILTLKQ